ncbi:ankyrin repeat domain-containing protein [Malaciobacter mytili]|uniref:ankyrin repeat domain-containing protein n=2 Tax=Malaciobacter mytili TaxID=603050 RepID=UPI003A88C642
MSFLDKLFGNKQEKKEEETLFETTKEFFQKDESIEELIKTNSLDVIKTKLDKTNFRQEDESFRRPLYYATINKKIEVIKYLFELGSDFEDAKATNGSTAISTLILSKDTKVLKTFIEYGYKITSGETKVMAMAISSCPLEFIKLLIELDVPMDSYTDSFFDNYTPLEYALINKREYPIIEALIEAGCPLNEEENTPFVCRLIYSSLEPTLKAKTLHLLKRLNKLDLTLKDTQGDSLIKQAITKGDNRSLKELIILGADFSEYPHQIKKMLSVKDLEDIATEINKENRDISEFLSLLPSLNIQNYIEQSKDLTNIDIVYQISINARIDEKSKIQLLTSALAKGANIETTPEDKNNVLYLLTKDLFIGKDLSVVKFLLENGAKIEYNGFSALFYAITNYNLPLIELLLEYNADVNFVDKLNEGVINYFYKENATLNTIAKKREIFQLLLTYKLDLNTKVSYKEKVEEEFVSFFTIFILENELRILQYILDNKEIYISDEESIYFAIKNLSKDELLKKIIAINPYYERKNYYKKANSNATVLALALEYLLEHMIEYLLDTYKEFKAYNETHPILLEVFHSYFSLELVTRLIQTDPNINRYYTFEDEYKQTYEATLLLQTVKLASNVNTQNRYFKIIKALLQNGADINATVKLSHKNKSLPKESSIFVQAVNLNKINKELYDLFYEYGGSLIKPISLSFNEMPIHTILQNHLKNDEVAVEYLEYCWQKQPFDILYKNNLDTDIFLGAAMNCLPKALKYLVNKGANIHIVGGFDNSPALHKAISNYQNIDTLQRVQTVQTLLDLGVSLEQFDNKQMTPLMCAAYVGTTQVVKELIKYKADVNNLNENNETAIHQAVLGKYSYDLNFRFETTKSKIIADLVEAGANINIVSKAGASALIYSISSNYREIFDTLLNLNANINLPCDAGYLPLYYAILQKDQYFINMLYKTGKLEVNKVNKFNFTVLHQLLEVNLHNKIFEEMLETLTSMNFDINYHMQIEPALLMYVKTMDFIGERQVGFVATKKKPKEREDEKAKLFIKYNADVKLCLEIAKKQKEPLDIIEYLEELQV